MIRPSDSPGLFSPGPVGSAMHDRQGFLLLYRTPLPCHPGGPRSVGWAPVQTVDWGPGQCLEWGPGQCLELGPGQGEMIAATLGSL